MLNKCFINILALTCLLNLYSTVGFTQNTTAAPQPSSQATANIPIRLPKRGGPATTDPELLKRSQEFNAQVNVFWLPALKQYQEGKLAEAEKNCLQAIAMREEHFYSRDGIGRVFLGQIYLKGGQYQKALEQFLPEVGRQAGSRTLELDVALIYARQGNFAQAQRYYAMPIVQQAVADVVLGYSFGGKKANADNLPDITDAESLYANILLAHGAERTISHESDEALADFAQADKLRPKNQLVHLFWGLALRNLDRDAEAIPHLQIAAQRGNGVVMKTAQERLSQAQQHVEGLKRWKEQQARKQAAKTSVPSAPNTPQTNTNP